MGYWERFYQMIFNNYLLKKEKQLDKDYQRKIFNLYCVYFNYLLKLLLMYISKIFRGNLKNIKMR